MDVAATLSSRGQVTIPKAVCDALGLTGGDRVIFKIAGSQATIVRTPGLIALAGTVPVPEGKRGAAWADVRREAHRLLAHP